MDFAWSDENDAFRTRVRDFLDRVLPSDWDATARHGPGSREQTEFSLSFCPQLAEAGLLVPHWPAEWGGADRPTWEHFILGEEMWAAGEPRGGQYMNVNWIGPVLMRYGSDAQKQRYLPPMAAGRAIWCQGFSEPGAGSDLASLRTRALRDGDDYVINGQKIWTSYAGLAETCFLLARTGEGRNGIAVFLVPMDTPGIEVRAIPSLIGHGDIHEVFFTDVRVPASCRLGDEGEGWTIISYALANERVGIPRYEMSSRELDAMVAQLKARDGFDNAVIRTRAAEAAAACDAARMLVYRVVDERARGEPPGTAANLARVAVVEADHKVTDFGMDFLPDCYSGTDHAAFQAHHERAIVTGIAAGAAEIQLNLVARRHLDLPKGA
ncbi:acyl-CoA dehydrogenase family protein [Maritimibacter sp. UBA3975]|uniref:acyl-CoA dehydrogenase family protein n=1 Tax=Maritimibacter sp. UBA3975 TaxID=1946833 RepID=UPI000C0AB861|nr:acyl-CoA dehydrogenase family protein [Maritimibacter sp. UBA3975]MAM62197.1 acyl-CoA dehydrogenase [Maritimibacter sp.]|tara:strand:+ start:53489 stop:54631 length:1143 start_codon:yes stop_codon:yes gene_type:complete